MYLYIVLAEPAMHSRTPDCTAHAVRTHQLQLRTAPSTPGFLGHIPQKGDSREAFWSGPTPAPDQTQTAASSAGVQKTGTCTGAIESQENWHQTKIQYY